MVRRRLSYEYRGVGKLESVLALFPWEILWRLRA